MEINEDGKIGLDWIGGLKNWIGLDWKIGGVEEWKINRWI